MTQITETLGCEVGILLRRTGCNLIFHGFYARQTCSPGTFPLWQVVGFLQMPNEAFMESPSNPPDFRALKGEGGGGGNHG